MINNNIIKIVFIYLFIYLFNVEYKQIAIEKQKTFTKLIKFDHTQGDTFIALTEIEQLSHL